jgi:carbonic anhydrase/acetyltransferase-like protein (isoleucine patch superfamily)
MPVYSLKDLHPQFAGEHWIASNATVIGDVHLGHDVSIWWNAVLRGDRDTLTIGDRTNIQDGSVLHADPGIPLTLGADVTIGHLVMLHGCTVGDGSLIGIGSILLNRSVIGRNSIVGANTLIPEGKVYPDGVLIVGSPGRVLRELTPEEIERQKKGAAEYVDNWRRYVRDLKDLRG